MRPPSKSGTFLILMTASAVSAFLLVSWTDWLRGPFQPLALGQWPVSASTRETAAAIDDLTAEDISPERALQLARENDALRQQLVEQQGRLTQLQQALDSATGLAAQSPDGNAVMVLAPVVSYDANPRRDTLLVALNERTHDLVRQGQWVAAAILEPPGQIQPSRRWLVGRVSEVQMRLARVQLATDPGFRTRVHAAQVLHEGDDTLHPASAGEGCILDGQGGGRMLISQAEEDYFASGYRIVVVPASRMLPSPLVLGRIESSKQRDDSARHYDLTVVPWGPVEALTHVYVISPGQIE
ncbi:MAG: hypothetical protein KAY37_06150 [Phycisphaerae bacterium]|nr:hypothetical protein [Phycisphaerae bacterium]